MISTGHVALHHASKEARFGWRGKILSWGIWAWVIEQFDLNERIRSADAVRFVLMRTAENAGACALGARAWSPCTNLFVVGTFDGFLCRGTSIASRPQSVNSWNRRWRECESTPTDRSHAPRATSPPRPPSPTPHCFAMLRGEGGARKEVPSGLPLSTSGIAAKLERGPGGEVGPE